MRRGLLRLAIAFAMVLTTVLAGRGVMALAPHIGLFVSGFMLLFGGYFALAGVYVAVAWVIRGFRTPDQMLKSNKL
jgi:hypothetical protein